MVNRPQQYRPAALKMLYSPGMERAVAGTERRRRRRKKQPQMPRSLLWILDVAVVACGTLLVYRKFFDTASDYDRAMSACISGQTQGKETLSGEEVTAIAASCAASMRPPQ